MRLLIACARQLSDTSSLRRYTEFSAVDWPAFRRLTELHGLAGVAYSQLDSLQPNPVPAVIREEMRIAQRAGIQRGLRDTAALIEVLHLLSRAGLHPLPYKGPALAAQLLDDPALRDAVDLDILVPEDDAPQALRLLEENGFVLARKYPPSAMGQLFAYRAEIALVRQELLLELQWRLSPKYFSAEFDIAGAWQRRQPLPLANTDVAVMSGEDHLLALSIHGTKHQWERLKWVLDIDLLVQRNPSLDWDEVTERARHTGLLRLLLVSLTVSRRTLETPLPDSVIGLIALDEDVTRLTADCLNSLVHARNLGEAEHHRLMLALRERASDRLKYMLRLAFQPTESEWEKLALPNGLQWIYYLLRLGRVTGKWLARGA
jgi:hypothetical protein